MRFTNNKFQSGTVWLFLIITEIFAQGPDTLWTREYGGQDIEYGYSIKQTFDGNFIVVGTTKSYGGGGYDIWLLKLNANGDTIWTKTYGGPYDEAGNYILENSDGGYIIVGRKNNYGTTYDDVWLLKTDINGDTIWTRCYGGNHNEYGRSVQLTTDGGYIIAGSTYSFGQGTPTYPNVYVVKTDSNGDTLWTKVFGQNGLVADIAYAVIQTSDGGYIISGYTGLQNDIYLIKIDSNGDTVWTKRYGGSGYEVGYSIIESDGAYVVAGYTNSYGPNPSNFYLLKIDTNGDTIWTKVYDCGNDEHGHSVQQTYDGGYIIAGYTYQYGEDICLVRTDSNGNVLWTKTYPKVNHSDVAFEVQQTADHGYIIVGYTHYWYFKEARAYEQLYVVKTRQEQGVKEQESSKNCANHFKITPNPFTNYMSIEYYLLKSTSVNINIYDVLGRKIKNFYKKTEKPGSHRIMWSGYDDYNNKLHAGVYFVEYNGLIKKIVKAR